MFYITVRQPPMYHQMTLDEFLFGEDQKSQIINYNTANTRTYETERISERLVETIDVDKLIQKITIFNDSVKEIKALPRHDLYETFYIPKKSGGLRKIDAPKSRLMDALRRLKTIFEEDYKALYHTSAFAYVRHRSIIDALKRHQANESKWFGKYDLSNFFGSITLEYTMSMLSMIFPFSEIVNTDLGRESLKDALELAFLDGALPQGTPFSPLITNVIMIPVDFKLSKIFRDYNRQRFVYTRYADDFLISSKYTFSFKEIEAVIISVLSEFQAPFTLNSKKTRYGSSSGSNWNLGLMLNKDNNITVGYKRKKQFQAMLSAYVMDRKNGKAWGKSDIQVMEGHRQYYRMVEKETIDAMVEHLSKKHGVNIVSLIKKDLKSVIKNN